MDEVQELKRECLTPVVQKKKPRCHNNNKFCQKGDQKVHFHFSLTHLNFELTSLNSFNTIEFFRKQFLKIIGGLGGKFS